MYSFSLSDFFGKKRSLLSCYMLVACLMVLLLSALFADLLTGSFESNWVDSGVMFPATLESALRQQDPI